MLGMVEGNGHPYSWSAIFNGYDSEEMATCPYPTINAYLNREPKMAGYVPGAKVTHIWADNLFEAQQVAQATYIPNVVEHAEDVIGQVDAVLVATDRGSEHVERCRPFIEAGLPVFVDKPMVDGEGDLVTFSRWVAEGAMILSSSSMRYCREYLPYRALTHDLGTVRYMNNTTCKSWERYGIHPLEGIYPIIGTGFLSARNTGSAGRDIVHLKHRSGADIVVSAIHDMNGAFGLLTIGGTHGYAQVAMSDIFYSFRAQLESFIQYLRTGVRPFPFVETVELMKMLIAGLRSRAQGGREVFLSEIAPSEEASTATSAI